MDAKEKAKKVVNTAQSGPQKLGHHSGRLHNPVEKVVNVVKENKTVQKQALKDRQSAQDHE